MSEDRFVTLRRLLSMWPQELLWERICGLLRSWPESAERDAAMAYADAHLDAWPESLRVANVLHDWPTFPYGEPSPVWRLGRTLHSTDVSESICQDISAWRALVDTSHLSHLTCLDWLYSSGEREDEAENLLLTHAASCFAGVGTLILNCDYVPLWSHAFFSSVRGLKRLVCVGEGGPALIEWLEGQSVTGGLALLSISLPTTRRDDPPPGPESGVLLLERIKTFGACTSLSLGNLPWTDEVVPSLGELLSALPIKRLTLSLVPQAELDEDAAAEAVEAVFRQLPMEQLASLSLKRLKPGRAVVDGLLARPGCDGLRELSLCDCGIDFEAAEALSAWPPLAQLTRLALDQNPLYNRGLRSLLQRSYPELTRLSLRQCHISLPGAQALAQSPHLPALQSLDLHDNDVRSVGTKALAASTQLDGLKELILSENSVYWTGYKALAQSEGLAGLESLSLYSYSGYVEGRSLFNLSHFDLPPGLSKLELSTAWAREIEPEQMAAFTRLDTQRRLLEVKLSHHQLPVRTVKQLSRAKHLSEMMRLELAYCQIVYDGVVALAKAKHFHQLRSLELNGNEFGDKGAVALSKASWLPQLWELHLAYCGIGDEGARQLVASGQLVELRELSFQGSELSLDAALFLIQTPLLPHLASLTVGYQQFEGEQRVALYDAASLHKPWLRLTV